MQSSFKHQTDLQEYPCAEGREMEQLCACVSGWVGGENGA